LTNSSMGEQGDHWLTYVCVVT